MIYKNAKVFNEGVFEVKDVRVEGDRIVEVGSIACNYTDTNYIACSLTEHAPIGYGHIESSRVVDEVFADKKAVDRKGVNEKVIDEEAFNKEGVSEEIIDLDGYYLLPGVIDVHTHGCLGHDFSDITMEAIAEMEAYYVQNGVTSILATVMTGATEKLVEAVQVIRAYQLSHPESIIKGIHLEGPFFGETKKGAHESKYLRAIDAEWFEALDGASGGQIKLVSIDPTLEGVNDFITQYSREKVIALGHTEATYVQAKEAVASGARQITHLFNAMNGLHHREPGLFGVMTEDDVYAELITDGVHVHPSVVKMCFNANPEKLIIISDSISAAGLKEGERCISGGMEVMIKEGKAVTAEGVLAGSTCTGYEVMCQAIKFGVKAGEAIQSATERVAEALRLEKVGKIAVGYAADVLVIDSNYDLKAVIQAGKLKKNTVFEDIKKRR